MALLVDVTNGERTLAVATLREKFGQPLDLTHVTMSLTPIDSGAAHIWYVPDESATTTDASVVVVSLLVDGRFPPGIYRLWIQVVDNPETVFVAGDGGQVTVT